MSQFMTPAEITAYQPDPPPKPGVGPLERARRAISHVGHWHAGQQYGRRWPVGCVALEITQRCNLDCTLCYLSENSEAVHDLPMAEIHRRIGQIHRHYGSGTDVQITGGEPTLRKAAELVEVVRAVRAKGMRPTLMTNGIRATRELLASLCEAGLYDVAFHVDTTQEIKGYRTEVELNTIRARYIERTRGLPLSVFFNTTVHRGNFHEIPELVRFFVRHADAVRTASFQLQADTGRGVAGKRDVCISPGTVTAAIDEGVGTRLNFDASLVGHPECNRYGKCAVVGGRVHDLFDDAGFVQRLQTATASLSWNRRSGFAVATTFMRWLGGNPRHWGPILAWLADKGWRMRRDLLRARGRIHALSFVVHNFMDAACLDRERIDGCAFKTMTRDGPISMCLHNAKRDTFILAPIEVPGPQVGVYWQPLSGIVAEESRARDLEPGEHPLKRLRGRSRRRAMEARRRAAG